MLIRGERWLLRLDFAEHVSPWSRSCTVDELVDNYGAERHPSGSLDDVIVPASRVDDVRLFLVDQERDGTLRYGLEPDADRD